MRTRHVIAAALTLLALVLLAAGTSVALDLRRAYARIAAPTEQVMSPYGDIQFVQGGSGPPVLVVHGSGGGWDQGELLARAVLGDGFRWIAPSRFGYLGSALPAAADFDAQAQAFVHLLDHLGLERVAVLALSHGAPSALLLAALHPQRVSSLTLLSGGVAASADPAQAQADAKGDTLTLVYRHDLLYWAASRLLRGWFVALMGADRRVLAGLDAEQRSLVDRVIDGMNPVEPRHAGVRLDNRAAMPGERIAAIRAPTLILHARDDTLQLFRHASYAAATIPGARLHAFDRGGHLLVAVELPAIRQEVQAFIRAHAGD